jgi:hypothetical protein
MEKTWALGIANGGVALTTTVSVVLTHSVWPLIGLLLVPLNLFIWRYTSPGIKVVTFKEGDEILVEIDTTKDKNQ